VYILILNVNTVTVTICSQKYMPARKTGEEMNFTYVECLLYVLHHLAHKVV